MLVEKLTDDMKAAMKAGEKQRLSVIRMLLSELKNAKIARGQPLEADEEQKVLASYAKRRREAIDAARAGGREEIAIAEEFEHGVTMSYLPEQMTPEALRAVVEKHAAAAGASGPQAFGAVMKLVMGEVGSSADGKAVSAIVKQVLG